MTGLDVPEDVAVVGVDDDHLICNLSNPPLSSVAVNLGQAGYQAAELLDNLIQGTVRQRRQIVAEALWVVGRRWSNVIATEDRHIAAALRFIRDHARQSIGVDDGSVREAGISQRGWKSVSGERDRALDPQRNPADTAGVHQAVAGGDRTAGGANRRGLRAFAACPSDEHVPPRDGRGLAQFRRRMRIP